MLPYIHFISAVLVSVVLALLNWQWWQIALFFLMAFFIDVDHYFLYLFTKKDFNIKRAYKYFKSYKKSAQPKEKLFIFHTIEFLILLVVMTIISVEIFFPLLIGFMVHKTLDVISSLTNKEKTYKRAFSLIGYIINLRKNAKRHKSS